MVVLAVPLAASACTTADPEPGSDDAVAVFAAASLTEAVGDLAADFEAEHDLAEVELNFLSSADLATQIIEGAPADVFLSADEPSMARLVDEGLAADPRVFALNRLIIATAAGNPHGITGLDDLADDALVISVCGEPCPAGLYAAKAFDLAGVMVEPDSFEPDVRTVVTRVGTGEADAGIVYVTDLGTARDVEGVSIPAEHNVVAEYPIALVGEGSERARDFVAFILSEAAAPTLLEYGFEVP